MRCEYTPLRIEKKNPKQNPWQYQLLVRMCSNRESHSPLMKTQSVTATLEESLAVLTKLDRGLPHERATALLSIYLTDPKI